MTLTTTELIAVLGFLFTLLSSGALLWWMMMRKITSVKDELHEHRLYAAENFVTTRQMRGMSEDMHKSVERVEVQIQGMSERFDNFLTLMAKKGI